jgi:hypothetical protein
VSLEGKKAAILMLFPLSVCVAGYLLACRLLRIASRLVHRCSAMANRHGAEDAHSGNL